jgi:phosphoadenosine phosphosulfate reductase
MAYDNAAQFRAQTAAATPVETDPKAALAARLNAELRHASPSAIIEAAVRTFGDKLALVSSFGAESGVLLHMAAQITPNIPVLFLDTGMHFGQTLDYRKNLAAKLGLTQVRDLRPAFEDLATKDPKATLWQTDVDGCCHIRKVLPLDRAVEGFDAWITGRKRFQASTRMSLPVVEYADGKLKFNPLANASPEELAAYVETHALPAHPLVAQGYPSIGCWPCTKPVEEGADARSGRWQGLEKTECGIHLAHAPGEAANVGGDI